MKRSTRNAITVCGFLAILALIYRSVFTGHLLAGRDVFRIFFPDSAFLLESLSTGELPLWNPYLRLGQPFAATLYSQVFYPPRWVAVVLTGPITSMTVMQIFHAAVAAVGVFLLARQLRLSWAASIVAGAVFGLSPMMTDLGIQQNVVNAAAWSGFIVAAARSAAVQPGPRPIAWLAAFTALSLLAGSPETTLWQGIVSLLAVWGAQRRGAKAPSVPGARRWTGAARVVGGLALAGALGALVMLPAAEFALNSLRTNAASFAEQRLAWSVSWPQLLAMVWPLADWPRGPYWGEDQWFILNQFLGSVACALAVVGAIAGPRRARPFAVGALLFALLSLGRHFPPAAALLHLPPFSLFRYPAKYFVGAAFCLSLLSGFGLEAMGRLSRRIRPSILRAVLAFVGMGVALGVAGPLVQRLPMRESAEAGISWPLLFLGLATVFVFVLRDTFARPRRLRHALAALAVLELVAAHHLLTVPKYSPYEPLARTSVIRQRLPEALNGRISADIEGPADPTRSSTSASRTIEQSRDRLIPNRFVEERLTALEGYGAPEPARSDVFNLAGERSVYDLTGVTWYVRNGPPPFDDLELLETLEDGTTLSRSRTALPRAFLVQKARVVPDEEALEAVIDPAQPFRHTAFLTTGEPLDRPPCEGTARIVASQAQRVEVEVEACDESYLVVTDSHYPGWRATLDGTSTPLHRADYALRAVRIPAGTHKVLFEYAPWSFRVGLAVSLLALGGLVASLFVTRHRPPQ
ncbi:YfhO family protein [Hyalangium sp.]|uniref:YfhO family protein n=1 Tax=Hyalangium sp. TaxID=2028555 RepID=UPI002D4E3BE9|nr:YfhO family protein [Hyalangium sp.]HYH96852.1 YfhO family protein [Hyalangium sp.]